MDVQNYAGETALMLASYWGYADVVALLLNAGQHTCKMRNIIKFRLCELRFLNRFAYFLSFFLTKVYLEVLFFYPSILFSVGKKK